MKDFPHQEIILTFSNKRGLFVTANNKTFCVTSFFSLHENDPVLKTIAEELEINNSDLYNTLCTFKKFIICEHRENK